jgi:hypothetical protein
MTDRALLNAEKRRDRLAAEINKKNQEFENMRKELENLRKEIEAVDLFVAEWHRFADSGETEDTAHQGGEPGEALFGTLAGLGGPSRDVVNPLWSPGPGPGPVPTPPKNPSRQAVGEMAKTIIVNSRRPVPRSELFQALANAGLIIHGKNPEMVLSTMMWRMQEEFVRIPGHGYWLRNSPHFEVGYFPGQPVQSDQEDVDILSSALDFDE